MKPPSLPADDDTAADSLIPLVIGCPVAHRAWILDAWFDHILASCDSAGMRAMFAFVVDQNDECLDIIRARADRHVLSIVSPDKGTDRRTWLPARYRYMVEIRNLLLSHVRALRPARFLSIDSDILAHPDLVARLTEDLDLRLHDAVGGKCYMTDTSVRFPSWARLSKAGQLQRFDSTAYLTVDVIMAIKMMNPRAYGIDYAYDNRGEDIGWSKACTAAGLRLAWDGRVTSKHVLAPHMLERVDERVGF